jgi:hypothetical protein
VRRRVVFSLKRDRICDRQLSLAQTFHRAGFLTSDGMRQATLDPSPPRLFNLPAMLSRKLQPTSTATIGFEAKLWLTADKLRDNMDAAEYKHVVLSLIFLKYISDTFEEHRAKLLAGKGDYKGAIRQGILVSSKHIERSLNS